jgi:hypothetical protein
MSALLQCSTIHFKEDVSEGLLLINVKTLIALIITLLLSTFITQF